VIPKQQTAKTNFLIANGIKVNVALKDFRNTK